MASAPTLPAVPAVLKSLQTFMKIATDMEKMDAVIGYWCRFYVVQNGLKIDSKSKESVSFLTSVMSWLEKEKKLRHDNEAITNEMVGQAQVENFALGIFVKADTDDREGRANKNTARFFLIASNLLEVLSVFGELQFDIIQKIKYAKWKAIYITKCLKSGETPVPGPVAGTDAEEFMSPNPSQPNINENDSFGNNAGYVNTNQTIEPNAAPMSSSNEFTAGGVSTPITATNGVSLSPEDLVKAQKLCKFAGSALQYEDVPTAITNLQKALSLLTTGNETF